MRCSLVLAAFVSIVLGLGVDARAEGDAPGKPGRHALLVGCTRYPSLEERCWLRGPANDVALLKTLLVGRFGFPGDAIVSLAEDLGGEETRPTRANIERELRALAAKVGRGDRVIILLSGHGSQEPDRAPLDERDGKDEIFLPADAGKWDRSTERVENAIRDDELGAWLGAIRDRGASVWLIVDSCHSGGMMRGNDVEVARHLDPHDDLEVPEEALAKALPRGGDPTAGPPEGTLDPPPGRAGGIVAIYAAQPGEVAPELPLPRDRDKAPYQGLLTYTIGEILTQAASAITYRQLVRRIHAQYAARNRVSPTPLIEGEDQDQAVLDEGVLPDRPAILLMRVEEDWAVNAGALHGLTPGSILAVYPPAGQEGADGQPLGYVRVTSTGLDAFDAEVDPWDYLNDRRSEGEGLVDGGRCRPISIDYGDMRMKVAIDAIAGKDVPAGAVEEDLVPLTDERREQLSDGLKEEAADDGSLFAVVEDPERAEWLVRPVAPDRDELYLVPGAGWPRRVGGEGALPPLFGPLGADRTTWRASLNQIARVKNLLKLVGGFEAAPAPGPSKLRVDLELRLYADRDDTEGTPIVWGPRGIELHDGDILGVRVTNPNREKIELTLLSIDGGYGIAARFPRAAGDDNVLLPGKSLDLPRSRVTSKTVGLESLVAIAVKSSPQAGPIDFTFLAEETISRARDVARDRGGEDRTIDSPLGRLLQNAAFAEGSTRSLSARNLDDYALGMITWKTLAGARPGAAK
jgi:hypothetical protein